MRCGLRICAWFMPQSSGQRHGDLRNSVAIDHKVSPRLIVYDAGALGALEPRQRGPRPPSADAIENVQLRRDLERSQADLKTARRVIEVQGNVSALLEELLGSSSANITPETDERRSQR